MGAEQATELQDFELRTGSGPSARVMPYGARLVSLTLPGAEGARELILRYRTPAAYLQDPCFLGASVGRFANRIAGGRCTCGTRQIQLPRNDRGHTLHGGDRGLFQRLWQVESRGASHLRLAVVVEAWEDGFPGRLRATAEFRVDADSLSIDYLAEVDQTCPISLTAHPYFCLDDSGGALAHEFQIHPSRYLPVDRDGIPSGAIASVQGTPLDFRRRRRIDPADFEHPELAAHGGYDHCWVAEHCASTAQPVALAWSPRSRIGFELSSNLSGLQFYTGNALGAPHRRHAGFCLEPQHWPDAPNQSRFPNALLRPGERFEHRLRYRFFEGPPTSPTCPNSESAPQ